MADLATSEQATVQAELNRHALATLQWVLGGVGVLFTVFFVYNLVDLPVGVREPALVYDAALVVAAGLAWWLAWSGRVPAHLVHPLGAITALASAGNVLMVLTLLGDPTYTVYIDIIAVAVGASLLDMRWTVATLGGMWGAWASLAILVTDPQSFVRYAFTLVAATVLGIALQSARLRDHKAVVRLRAVDRAREALLEQALDEARTAQRELDAKVADRTAALLATNEALLNEIMDRRLAQQAVDTLAEQLEHAQQHEPQRQAEQDGGVDMDEDTMEVWPPATDSLAAEQPADAPSASIRKLVLFVEDDPIVRRLGQRVLASLDYDVLLAADADEAESIAARVGHIDVLCTDIQMPGRTGVELARAMRVSHPELPVVLCSGYVGDDSLDQGLPVDAQLLHKPYTRPDLAQALLDALKEG